MFSYMNSLLETIESAYLIEITNVDSFEKLRTLFSKGLIKIPFFNDLEEVVNNDFSINNSIIICKSPQFKDNKKFENLHNTIFSERTKNNPWTVYVDYDKFITDTHELTNKFQFNEMAYSKINKDLLNVTTMAPISAYDIERVMTMFEFLVEKSSFDSYKLFVLTRINEDIIYTNEDTIFNIFNIDDTDDFGNVMSDGLPYMCEDIYKIPDIKGNKMSTLIVLYIYDFLRSNKYEYPTNENSIFPILHMKEIRYVFKIFGVPDDFNSIVKMHINKKINCFETSDGKCSFFPLKNFK